MSAWAAVGAVVVVAVVVGVRQARVWVQRRQAVHQAWVRLVLAGDREVDALEACWVLPVFERQEQHGD